MWWPDWSTVVTATHGSTLPPAQAEPGGQKETNLGGICCRQNAVYQRSIYLYDITAGPHKVFLKKNFFHFAVVGFCKVTGYTFFEYPVAFQPLPLYSIPKYEQKCSVWPCSELLWPCLGHKNHLVLPTVVANWRRSLYSYSTEQLPTVTQLCTVAKLVLCRTIAECPL